MTGNMDIHLTQSSSGGLVWRAAKRLLDAATASVVAILLLPVLLTVAAVVRIRLGRPVFFRQLRPGLHGKPFTMYKFRTMREARDAQGNALPDGQRLTSLGKWLRKTSLDELPELWNVLRGDMSLVGPRPLRMEYLDRYTPEQARRHDVRPGVTGWAQVNGRNAISWEEKFRLDVWYVDHYSPWVDLRILWMTVGTVFRRKGIAAEAHATMPEFMGSDPASGGPAEGTEPLAPANVCNKNHNG